MVESWCCTGCANRLVWLCTRGGHTVAPLKLVFFAVVLARMVLLSTVIHQPACAASLCSNQGRLLVPSLQGPAPQLSFHTYFCAGASRSHWLCCVLRLLCVSCVLFVYFVDMVSLLP